MLAQKTFGRLALALAITLALAACGGSASNGPGGGGGDGDNPTEAAPTEEGGGGGSGVDQTGADPSKGTVHAQVTGGTTLTIDLAASPAVSHFETNGDKSGYLVFINADGTEVFFLTLSPEGILIQYAKGTLLLMTGAGNCTAQVDELDDSHAKGSFNCADMVLTDETNVGTASMSGTFEAHR